MACAGCEARREWIKKQTELANERLKQLLQRLTDKTARAEQSADTTKSATD